MCARAEDEKKRTKKTRDQRHYQNILHVLTMLDDLMPRPSSPKKRSRELDLLKTHGSPWVFDDQPVSASRKPRPSVPRRLRTDESGILVGNEFQVESLPEPNQEEEDVLDLATPVDVAAELPAFVKYKVPEWDHGREPVDEFHHIAACYFGLSPKKRTKARLSFQVILRTLADS